MQKGYKREAKGMAILRCFIGLVIVIIVVVLVSFLLSLDYSDKLDPEASMRPYVETTPAPSLDPSASPEVGLADVSGTDAPEATATPTARPTPTPTPVPTPTPEPTPEPTSIPAEAYSAMRTDLKFPEAPTTNNAKIGITYSYRSEVDDSKVLQLRGYGYVDAAAFDGAQAQSYLVLKRESTSDRAVVLAKMSAGASGVEHADAACANASSADFEVVLSSQNLPDDIYTLGLILQYKTGDGEKLEYVEFPQTVSFTVLNNQFLGDVQVTD